MRRLTIFFGLPLLLLTFREPSAQALDPHHLYEEKCSGCHAQHAGKFVRDRLKRQGGRIVSDNTGRDLLRFLAGGHGKLEARGVDVLIAHFTNILTSGPIFRDRCLICHDRAVDLARHRLVLRNGVLLGRYTGHRIDDFLNHHGRLEGDEIPKTLDMLRRQLEPVSPD